MTTPFGVSIIVVNYNNERYLAAAIESALNQDYPLCEVIVVDDCSTDGSAAVIATYDDRVRSVLRETNGGHIAALNSAWPSACFPILIFLDSDDLLVPHAASTIARVWSASVAKAQFLLATIDKAGRKLGQVSPTYPPKLDTATIRAELLRTGQCPSTPSSGNAYSRSMLDRLHSDGAFDIENSRQLWMDALLECNSPFYGEIVTIHEPLACFRIHDSNDSLQNTIDYKRFTQGSRYLDAKFNYLSRRCEMWRIPFDAKAARDNSIWALECQLCLIKTSSPETSQSESSFSLVARGLTASLKAPLPISRRIFRAAWFTAVALTPRPVARQLIALRFMPAQRPAWFSGWLQFMRFYVPSR
jgi:glycosyltransferase involved in cell wall biosynthesis